jgi:hypothetical protein
VLIFQAVIEGIEDPDKNFLFDSSCRCVIRKAQNSLVLADRFTARIITHAPLRAKEASPFVSNKYPVVVCILGQWSKRIILIDFHRTTSTMRLSLELVGPVYGLLSVLPRLVSTPPAYPSSSQLEVTLLRPKEESTLLSGTCTRMIGGGTCTIRSKVRIGSETRMLSTT